MRKGARQRGGRLVLIRWNHFFVDWIFAFWLVGSRSRATGVAHKTLSDWHRRRSRGSATLPATTPIYVNPPRYSSRCRFDRRSDGARSRAARIARHCHRARGSCLRYNGAQPLPASLGRRYCVTDRESAIECIDENMILRKIMPDLLELNDGLFVALTEADLAFKERFLEGCAACHIPAHDIPVKHALAMEPYLNPGTLAAVQVPDGVFEPFRFCLAFLATARLHGALVRRYAEVTDFISSGKSVTGAKLKDRRTGKSETLGADLVVNAAGPWAGEIAAMAGVSVPEVPTAGVMVTLDCRLNNMVLNRLNKPSDGDIVVPQRATSVIGTTSWTVEDPDLISIPPEHVERMISQGELLLPLVRKVPMRAKMAVARP